MLAGIGHRGPDDSGLYVRGTTGLAHARLSIIDLALGHQPMLSPDGSTAIVFNGEIFNYVELREELMRRGRRFVTQSDTEVILHLYEELGTDFVKEMNGQFAIALWDDRRKRLVLARDRVGICPLFYKIEGDRLIFASEVKALAPALSQPLEISPLSLDQVFTFWSTVSPRTIFEDVLEVSPGTQLILENGKTRIERYWDWEFPDGEFDASPEQELAERLRHLLIDATRIRLRSDVPVGAYLSGGLDSSVLVSILRRYCEVPLRSFSLAFEDENLDESSYQDLLIKSLDAEHSRMHVRSEDIAGDLVDTIKHTETPVLRTAPVPMGRLSGLVRNSGYKVVMTGEGADEVLGGYDLFKEAKVRRFWAAQPDSQVRPLLLKRLYPYLKLPSSGQAGYLKQFFGGSLDQCESPFFSHIPRWTTTALAKRFFSAGMDDHLARHSMDAMSASLPVLTTQPSPSPRSKASETAPYPSAPLCVTKPMPPGTSRVEAPEKSGEKELTCPVAVPTVPMQLGPSTRTPSSPATCTSSSCSCAPAGPVSANPLEQTMTTPTPAAAQSRTAASTLSAATITIAASTSPARAASTTKGYEASPATGAPSGRTG